MILTIDIGNTHTNIGIANSQKIISAIHFPTEDWNREDLRKHLKRLDNLVRRERVQVASIASVVPSVNDRMTKIISNHFQAPCLFLEHSNVSGIGIDYPEPSSIGADRLANSMAATSLFGAPVVVVDFGTAVTFDVIDSRAFYVGGIIAVGLEAMKKYLHEKTALLPKMHFQDFQNIQNPKQTIGKSTHEAMLIGAVKGYRGLISSLISELKAEMKEESLRVVATGGDAEWILKGVPQISKITPHLTLEGLRLLALDYIFVKKKRV